MEITAILMGLGLFGCAVMFVLRPFKAQKIMTSAQVEATSPAKNHREAVLAALRALDFDFNTGKVGTDDYNTLRLQLMGEAAHLMQSAQEIDKQLEELIRGRKIKRHTTRCHDCGAEVEAGEWFCSKCGSAVAAEACPQCGGTIKPRDLFCTHCGSKLNLQVSAEGQA